MSNSPAEIFYTEILDILLRSSIPFMVGGTYAFNAYTGITRATKDIDIITTKTYCLQILKLLQKKGFAVELLDDIWIGKVYHDDFFVDIIFAERNNVYQVKPSWFDLARPGTVLGKKVMLLPIEYMISTKVYVKFREKYDGSDINYLLLQYAKDIDWQVLTQQVAIHWQLLFVHLVMFGFVFPSARDTIPSWVIKKYSEQTQTFFSQTTTDKITHGHLISYEYQWAINNWHYKPTQ